LTIEVLYIDGCPNHGLAVERVTETLHEMNLAADVVELRITDPGTATSVRFLGSPTVLVNGMDIEPSARTSDQFGFGCRTYLNGSRRDGFPAKRLVREAILEAQGTTA
jgi:hypothetical protein